MFCKRTLCTFFLLSAICLAGYDDSVAQLRELEVHPITVDEALTVFLNHPGMAVIIIRSSLTTLTFDSNFQIVEQQNDPAAGEYILIIEPVTQTIRINVPGFLAGHIPVRGLSARQVVYYSVEPVAQDTDDTIPVVIRVEPADAIVEVDGQTVDISRSVPLTPGSHTLTISREGFRYIDQTIEVDRENTFNEFVLEQLQEVPITIRTQPAGATITIDGTTIGQSDANGLFQRFQFPDTYTVTVSMVDYVSEQREIEVTDRQNEFEFELNRSASRLVLDVLPAGATVTINRQVYDTGQPINLPPGLYRIEAEMQGYRTAQETIRLGTNETVEQQLELQPLTGTLRFVSSPASAAVTLTKDGEIETEWTGINQLELPIGTFQITVYAEGYEQQTETIVIEEDETLHKQVTLMPVEVDQVAEEIVEAVDEEPVIEQ